MKTTITKREYARLVYLINRADELRATIASICCDAREITGEDANSENDWTGEAVYNSELDVKDLLKKLNLQVQR